MLAKFFASLAGKLVLVALLLAVLLFGITQCRSGRNAAEEARVSNGQAEAMTESAADAIGSVGALKARDTRSNDLTRENFDAIRNAPGADAPVDSGVHGAGLDSLCRRAAYRGSEQCLQHAAAAGMAEAGLRRAAP